MNVAHFITAIEQHGVTFRVEHRRAGLTGRVQIMILIGYPNFDVEDLVAEDIELLRAHRTEVRKFLLDREAPELERARQLIPQHTDPGAGEAFAGNLRFNERQLELLCGDRGIPTREALAAELRRQRISGRGEDAGSSVLPPAPILLPLSARRG
jgi:hypothetical protein